MEDIKELRKEIDEIDAQLLPLYERRMEVCRRVGAYKKELGLPVLDPSREQDILERKLQKVQDPAMKPLVTAFYEQLMAQSRLLQTKLIGAENPAKTRAFREYLAAVQAKAGPEQGRRVIYQGQPGAYGEAAAIGYFGESCDRTPAKSFEGVFLAIQEGLGDYGVLPIENSSTGAINDVYDLLAKYGCYIVGEQIVRVEHALLAPKGASLDSICVVHSHEQGLLQCREFLGNYPHWEQTVQPNTAVSAKLVAAAGDPTQAAIASARSAELYGLEVLAEKINTNQHNYTRFVIVSDKPCVEASSDKISVTFTIPHTQGSLHRILSVFATNGLNLMKLESRPIQGKRWEYNFFADFSGNLKLPGMDDVVRQLIDETLSLRVMGNYKAAEL